MHQNPARSGSDGAIRESREKNQANLGDGRRRFRTGQEIREQKAPAFTRIGRRPLNGHDRVGDKGRVAVRGAVLAPGQLSGVPIHILQRETVVDSAV